MYIYNKKFKSLILVASINQLRVLNSRTFIYFSICLLNLASFIYYQSCKLFLWKASLFNITLIHDNSILIQIIYYGFHLSFITLIWFTI
jgi:hypothetical protein